MGRKKSRKRVQSAEQVVQSAEQGVQSAEGKKAECRREEGRVVQWFEQQQTPSPSRIAQTRVRSLPSRRDNSITAQAESPASRAAALGRVHPPDPSPNGTALISGVFIRPYPAGTATRAGSSTSRNEGCSPPGQPRPLGGAVAWIVPRRFAPPGCSVLSGRRVEAGADPGRRFAAVPLSSALSWNAAARAGRGTGSRLRRSQSNRMRATNACRRPSVACSG